MFPRAGAIPLNLRVGLLYLFSMAVVAGQGTNATSPTDLLQSGWAEFSSNLYAQAAQSFRAAILVAPTNADAYAGLGRSLCRLGQYPGAITNLERALALQPGHANWLLSLGESYSLAGEYSKATNFLQRYVSLRTNNTVGYTWLAYSLSQMGQYEAAVSATRRALALNPTNTYCYRQLGHYLAKLDRHEEAIQAFGQATALDPQDGDAYWQCALSLFKLRRFDEAATSLEKARANKKDDPAVRWLLFGCYVGSLQYRKAWQLFPGAVALAVGASLLVYLIGLGFLLPLSFRARPRASPGFWFSLAWLAAYLEGQVAISLVLGLIHGIEPIESVLAGMILAGIPLVMAGLFGFRQQRWGKPFAWPLPLGTNKTLLLCLLGLGAVWLFEWAYSGLV